MKRILYLLLILSLTIFILAGCSSESTSLNSTQNKNIEKNKKVLTIGISKEPANFNPVLASGVYAEALLGNIFDTLVSFKEDSSTPNPALAKSWDISDDAKTYTFYLREDVEFHNGEKLTAKDVKFTFESILEPDNASPSKQFFEPIDKIQIVDKYTIKIKLKNPYAPFLMALGNPTAAIIPKKVVEKIGMDEFDRHPIGTGPYKFKEWIPDDYIKLVKNNNYFIAEPNLDEVVFRPIPKPEVMAAEIQAGGIDIASNLLPQAIENLKKDNNLVVKTIPGLSFKYVGFSYQISPFSDLRFRKAVYHAVPFEQVVEGIFGDIGERAYSWIPPSVFPDDTKYMKRNALKYNPTKAKELFDELKAEGIIKDGEEISIYTPQDPYRKKVATAIATSLMKYGIKAKVEALEWGTLLPLLKGGKAGLYVLGWFSVPDPDRWSYRLFYTDSPNNFSKYSNSEVDKALDRGRSLVDREDRATEYKKVMRKVLTEDYIHIPLAFTNVTVVMNKNVKGFDPSPQEYFHLVTEERNVSLK
ncbi:ABC transporter substrate-binding protein [Orenia marismortui]|uniref:Peptide/nickel transport system substrate-binding protein n=1 Tax=Orenia marismortui TaxID=46469 RepID=A0A4R8GSQ5_9FIRM|nr:ABC transporter substrate-binding protein [Orenia marismortui]TDX46464.1 peptide/nickel transport system substrate-binding protein [Orenia marismortui]